MIVGMIESVAVKKWFKQHKRDLPFRGNPSPYRVWISEVMLQQTQVAVVIPYYEKWMERFPTIESLALTSEEEVVKQWEGLGYYSRARNLRKGAQQVVDQFGGKLPSNRKDLESIYGIGPYTAGAILSFAFKQKGVAIDGNVIRILVRYFAIEEEVKPKVVNHFHQILEETLECDEPHEVMEGLIELGALVCKKVPVCHECPLRKKCMGRQRGIVDRLPNKGKTKKAEKLYWQVPICLSKGMVQLKFEKEGIMKGLWHFPLIEKGASVDGEKVEDWEMVKHSYTHYQVHLYPSLWKSEGLFDGCEWVGFDQLVDLPFPSGHRILKDRLLANMKNDMLAKS